MRGLGREGIGQAHLPRDLFLLVVGKLAKWSYLVPSKNGIAVCAWSRSPPHQQTLRTERSDPTRRRLGLDGRSRTLLNPRAWRYHSLIELRVLFRVRSNMNKMATASLQTSGSIVTNLSRDVGQLRSEDLVSWSPSIHSLARPA